MILIVDDIQENVFSLQRTLEVNGFNVDAATSGEEALKKVLKNIYSLIILDVQMPGMDGFEVAELLSSSNRTKDTPIIFLSAVSVDKRFITRGYNVGAIDYLTKPVDPDILMLKVRAFHKLSENTRALKQAENELLERNAELSTVLESLPQLAFMASGHGTIEYVNPVWYNYSDNKGAFPVTKQGTAAIESFWTSAIQSQTSFEREVQLKPLGHDEYKYFLMKVVPLKTDGAISKWIGTFTDIHEQKWINELLENRVQERTEELREKNRMLEHSNYELQQFAAVASHDLKEPLRKIQIFSNIIAERNLSNDEQLNNYIQKISASCERMTRLINDLLLYSRLSKDVAYEDVDLGKVLNEVLSDLELTIAERNAKIDAQALPTIKAVPGQMRQIFQNIISNSLKFTVNGARPEITISTETVDSYRQGNDVLDKGPYCKISISDNGIGFDEVFLDKIFVIFQRLTTKEKHEGTGIGLAIAKKIVDKHKGSITAHSKLNEGATFVLVLPMYHN